MTKMIWILLLSIVSISVQADTEENTKLVTEFYNTAILQARHSELDRYIGDVYIQHNPQVADGKEGLRELLMRINPDSSPGEPSGEIVRVIAEDDLVVLHVKYYNWPGEFGGAVMDIFRVENGRIVEHWDVIQAIPEVSANDNTMF